jgi:hypothetical protein
MYVDILDIQGSLISPWGGIEPLDSPPPLLFPSDLQENRGKGEQAGLFVTRHINTRAGGEQRGPVQVFNRVQGTHLVVSKVCILGGKGRL